MALDVAPGDPLGRRGQIGWLAAAVVDAAVFHAVVRISAQAIGLGFLQSGNRGSGPVEQEESRPRRDQRDGTRINGPVMQGKMTADRRMVSSFRSGTGRGQSQSHKQKAASQCGLCFDTS